MERKKELEDLIIKCCESSSIYYAGKFPSVKYVCQKGTIVYVEESRMLDFCEIKIPQYDSATDDIIVEQIMKSSDAITGCESHKYDGHYCFTLSLRLKDV